MQRALVILGSGLLTLGGLLFACSSSDSTPAPAAPDAAGTWRCAAEAGFSKLYDKRYDCQADLAAIQGCLSAEPTGRCEVDGGSQSVCAECQNPPGETSFAYTARSCTCASP